MQMPSLCISRLCDQSAGGKIRGVEIGKRVAIMSLLAGLVLIHCHASEKSLKLLKQSE